MKIRWGEILAAAGIGAVTAGFTANVSPPEIAVGFGLLVAIILLRDEGIRHQYAIMGSVMYLLLATVFDTIFSIPPQLGEFNGLLLIFGIISLLYAIITHAIAKSFEFVESKVSEGRPGSTFARILGHVISVVLIGESFRRLLRISNPASILGITALPAIAFKHLIIAIFGPLGVIADQILTGAILIGLLAICHTLDAIDSTVDLAKDPTISKGTQRGLRTVSRGRSWFATRVNLVKNLLSTLVPFVGSRNSTDDIGETTWDPEDVRNLSNEQFKEIAAHLVNREGYKLTLVGKELEEGFDAIAVGPHENILIQTRREAYLYEQGASMIESMKRTINELGIQISQIWFVTDAPLKDTAEAQLEDVPGLTVVDGQQISHILNRMINSQKAKN